MRPERIRVRLWARPPEGATPLDLAARRVWPAGLVVAAMFVMFAGVEWTVIATMSRRGVRDLFDLMFLLFQGFWVLGWFVGVAVLGLLTAFFLFYGESAWLEDARLVYVPSFGPLKILLDYDLARVSDVRLETTAGEDKVRLRFDYRNGKAGAGTVGLGDAMPRADAERLVNLIRGAMASSPTAAEPAPRTYSNQRATRSAPAVAGDASSEPPPPALFSASGLALIGANLIPLIGVLFFRWDLASVMILYWAESAVIGFYTVLKMAIVGRFAALFAAPFFVGHFGGFMAVHFLFIYLLFVRGITATGPRPEAAEALRGIFVPLAKPLAAMFLSHGVSFVSNFIERREYAGTTMTALMTAPYKRIVVMHLAIIFGGWVILLLKSPVPALALFVLLKTALDFTAHQREHA
jgi:hypothetical protein